MPKIVVHKTDAEIRRIKAPGRHCIGPNFYLRVSDYGARFYEARVRDHLGRRRWIVLGDAERVTARSARQDAARAADRLAAATEAARVFRIVAEEHISESAPGWKGEGQERQWRQQLKDYVYPTIGDAPCDQIRASDVADILRPLWITKQETANRVRSRVEVVIRREMARLNRIEWNPATSELMQVLLPKRKRQRGNFEAPTLEELRSLYRALRDDQLTHRMLRFLILSATRTTEVRAAEWSEIIGDVWVIPADRMKANKQHRAPVTPAMERVLEASPQRGSSLIFPNPNGSVPSINAMRAILQRRKVNFTVHGTRATFRSWAAEEGVREDVAELCLAHTPENKLIQAYQRSDLLEERRTVMRDWQRVLEGRRVE